MRIKGNEDLKTYSNLPLKTQTSYLGLLGPFGVWVGGAPLIGGTLIKAMVGSKVSLSRNHWRQKKRPYSNPWRAMMPCL